MTDSRMFNLEANVKVQTNILAIRPVRLDTANDPKVTADVVEKWAAQILKQFELGDSHIPRVVTDGGRDVEGRVG